MYTVIMYVPWCLCNLDMRDMVKPSTLEKYILVIATVYRKPSDVPDRVR